MSKESSWSKQLHAVEGFPNNHDFVKGRLDDAVNKLARCKWFGDAKD